MAISEGSHGRRWVAAACLCAVWVLLWAPGLFAQESYGEFEQSLNLSEVQKAQVEGIKKKYMGEWNALKNESTRKRLELSELRRERPDQREKADRLEKDIDQLRASRQRLFRQYVGEVSTVFNDEQRGRFNRFMNHESRRSMNPPRNRHER